MEKILALRLDRLGDLMQTLPAIQALAESKQFDLTVGISPLYLPLVEPWLDIRWLGLDTHTPSSEIARLKEQGFSRLICFSHEKTARHLLPQLRFVPRRYGNINGLSAFWNYTNRIFQNRSSALQIEADYCMAMLKSFELVPPDLVRPIIRLPVRTSPKLENWFRHNQLNHKKYIVLHQGMRGSALNLSLEFYDQLASDLLQNIHLPIVLTGQGPKEAKHNRALAEKYPALIDSTDLWDIREMAALLDGARVVIAPATGVIHLANAVGTPIFGFFPPIKVQGKARWTPVGFQGFIVDPWDVFNGDSKGRAAMRCPARKKCWGGFCHHYPCMEAIQSDWVIAKLKEMLDLNAQGKG